jgi:hypothetical protein
MDLLEKVDLGPREDGTVPGGPGRRRDRQARAPDRRAPGRPPAHGGAGRRRQGIAARSPSTWRSPRRTVRSCCWSTTTRPSGPRSVTCSAAPRTPSRWPARDSRTSPRCASTTGRTTLVITDLGMPDVPGWVVVEVVKQVGATTPGGDPVGGRSHPRDAARARARARGRSRDLQALRYPGVSDHRLRLLAGRMRGWPSRNTAPSLEFFRA